MTNIAMLFVGDFNSNWFDKDEVKGLFTVVNSQKGKVHIELKNTSTLEMKDIFMKDNINFSGSICVACDITLTTQYVKNGVFGEFMVGAKCG